MKNYKSPNELLDIMKEKGIQINNEEEAINLIKKYSYYSIINSYKDVFKDNNHYKEGVTFEEIYSLYDFDKKLRTIILNYIFEIELTIKSLLAEVLSIKYGIVDYLNVNNYDKFVDKKNIDEIIDKVQNDITKQIGKHEAITHFYNEYGFVPPFVLIKIISFGELSKFYSILKQSDRQFISKQYRVTDKFLKQLLKNITIIRNICAHNERLFSFHSKFYMSYKEVDKNYVNKMKITTLYMIINSMMLLLDANKKEKFKNELAIEVFILIKKIKSIDINVILEKMGVYDLNIVSITNE